MSIDTVNDVAAEESADNDVVTLRREVPVPAVVESYVPPDLVVATSDHMSVGDTVRFPSPEGESSTLLEGEIVEAEGRTYRIRVHESFNREQQRQYVRVMVLDLEVEIGIAGSDEYATYQGFDMSATGMRVAGRTNLPMSDLLNLRATLPGKPDIALDVGAQVAWARRLREDTDQSTYHYGVEYTAVPEGMEEKLVRWVMSRQRGRL